MPVLSPGIANAAPQRDWGRFLSGHTHPCPNCFHFGSIPESMPLRSRQTIGTRPAEAARLSARLSWPASAPIGARRALRRCSHVTELQPGDFPNLDGEIAATVRGIRRSVNAAASGKKHANPASSATSTFGWRVILEQSRSGCCEEMSPMGQHHGHAKQQPSARYDHLYPIRRYNLRPLHLCGRCCKH